MELSFHVIKTLNEFPQSESFVSFHFSNVNKEERNALSFKLADAYLEEKYLCKSSPAPLLFFSL